MKNNNERLIELTGKRNHSLDDIDLINDAFHKAYHKKSNQLKRVAAQAKLRIYN